MQSLARGGLSAERVTALLQTTGLEVSAGCEVLSANLTVREDISDDLVGGRVGRNLNAEIHGTLALALSRELVWGVDLVRPYMVLSDGQVSARFNVGVYALTTPERQVGEDPVTYDVDGFDRLYLLKRQVGATYTALRFLADGVTPRTYRQALLDVFAASGLTGALIQGAAADDVLPLTRTWPLVADDATNPDQTDTPATYLRVVNDLLRAINFRSVWCDEDGLFRCESYREPALRPVEFVFSDIDPDTIVGEDRKVERDVFATPTRWVFRWKNPVAGTTVPDQTYTYDLPASDPQSALNRGLVWASVIDFEAASRTKLVELGDRKVAADRRATSTFTVTTGPFPIAGHADIFGYRDVAAGVSTKVQALAFSYDLSGSDVQWTWEAVA